MRREGGGAGARSAHSQELRASGRREAAMAEAAAGPGCSPGPAAFPFPAKGDSAGPQRDERCPGGASPEGGGAAPAPDSFLKPPSSKKRTTPGSSGRKKRPSSSPCEEKPPNFCRLSPILAPNSNKRRSWCRSSLKGRRSRRKSLPPVHQDITDLSKSISLELPEIQRFSSLLLSSFQFSARKLQQILEESEGFDPEVFSAKVQSGCEEFQRLLQRLLRDGTLGNCLEPPPGDSPDPTLDGSVTEVKEMMASLSQELQSWSLLLHHHQNLSLQTSRNLELFRNGNFTEFPPKIPNSQILNSKPDYGQILAEQGSVLKSLQLVVDELQEAGKLVMEFSEESRNYLKGLSEQLASRAFRKLQESPARKLLERKPQKALPGEGEK